MSNASEKLKRGQCYPLGDSLSLAECRQYGIPRDSLLTNLAQASRSVMAIWDGSPPRLPKKGEWYLSGSIIEAYRAPNDLLSPFYIGKLVKVERKTVEVIKIIEIE